MTHIVLLWVELDKRTQVWTIIQTFHLKVLIQLLQW